MVKLWKARPREERKVNEDKNVASDADAEAVYEAVLEPLTENTSKTTVGTATLGPPDGPPAEPAIREETPMSEATDIASTARTISERFQAFEADFVKAEDAQEDLLQRILRLMDERNELLTALADKIESENKVLAEFQVKKAG